MVFSAGNGHVGFPGMMPEVISVGGVFADQNAALKASDYASSFTSLIYPGRKVPDFCGLVGMRPRATYIMLPLQRGCDIDVDLGGGLQPNKDETATNDGWSVISGTSAAAPQVAGICALSPEKRPSLTPDQVKAVLRASATDVTSGTSSTGQAAGPGIDPATGSGLVHALRAWQAAMRPRSGSPPRRSTTSTPRRSGCGSSSTATTSPTPCGRSSPTRASSASRWRSRVGRQDVHDALGQRGIELDELPERAGLPDADPLDILVHLAWNQPLATRLDRTRRVRKEHADFFEAHQPAARDVLAQLLDKYAEHGISQLDDLGVLGVPPLSALGSPAEIAGRFGSPAALRDAVEKLGELLYAA